MTILRYFPVVILALFAGPTLAADANGYTAQYECRAGGQYCNVDVVALAAQPCEQTITPDTAPVNSWSAIDWSKNVICIQAGDHSGRGKLTLGSSGKPGAYKVLKYYRASDNNDEPWNQSSTAKIKFLNSGGRSYWLINRITVDPDGSNSYDAVNLNDNTTNVILNRALVEDWGSAGLTGVFLSCNGGTCFSSPSIDANTIQNSVIRSGAPAVGYDTSCVQMVNAINTHVVNSELYDCQDNVQNSEGSQVKGTVIENNDIYTSNAMFSDCHGNYTPNDPNSPCAASEGKIGFKYTSSDESIGVKYSIIHNRIWGGRQTDNNLCCAGGGTQGQLVSLSSGFGLTDLTHHVLVQNNIIFDGQHGIQSPRTGPFNHSVIGNIIYKIHDFAGLSASYGIYFQGGDKEEVYLNTIVDAPGNWANVGNANSDWLCNVNIASGGPEGSVGAGTQIDYNVYYNTNNSGETHKITNTVTTRANSTAYSVGTILRTGAASTCSTTKDAGCFLYRVTGAGTSASSSPSYTTTLGGTSTDGTMTVQAIRGPYSFKRKLRTVAGGESYVIPYAKVDSSAPEQNYCPNTVGSRKGIGANDAAVW